MNSILSGKIYHGRFLADISPPSQFLHLKDQLYQWVDDTSALVVDLEKLADNLDEHFKNISKAKVGGATGAVVGGLLAAAGFGFSFVTFGASLGLAVAGKSSKTINIKYQYII